MKPLHKTLKYIDGHICKSKPTEFAVFYFDSPTPAVEYFRALIDFKMKVNILREGSGATIEDESNHELLVDIFDDAQVSSETMIT